MARWKRVARGMIGMGLTFATGVGVVASTIAAFMWRFDGEPANEMFRVVAASSMWALGIGVVFSGVLAITARGRSFDKLSLPRFALQGSGVGLFFYGLLATNAWQAWSPTQFIGNAVILVTLGGGSAAGALLLARKTGAALSPGREAELEPGREVELETGREGRLGTGREARLGTGPEAGREPAFGADLEEGPATRL